MPKHIAVIVNAGAGGAAMDKKVADLRNAFNNGGVDAEFLLSHAGTDASAVARAALDKGAEIVVAAGGDGTINAVASEIITSPAALAIIPFGTFNHLSKDLGIPQKLDRAVELIKSGNERMIDVAEVNGKIFLNNSSIGIYSKLVRMREEREQYGFGKGFAMLLSVLSLIWRYTFLSVEVEVNGKLKKFYTPLVVVGNNRYAVEGSNFGKRTRLDEGVLSLFVIKHAGPSGLAKLLLHALKTTLRQHELFEEYYADSVILKPRKRIVKVGIDGEVISLSAPLSYKIKPLALRVIAP